MDSGSTSDESAAKTEGLAQAENGLRLVVGDPKQTADGGWEVPLRPERELTDAPNAAATAGPIAAEVRA